MKDTVLLDLRDERGRFFTKVRIDGGVFARLELLAKLRGITFEQLLHEAIEEHAKAVLS